MLVLGGKSASLGGQSASFGGQSASFGGQSASLGGQSASFGGQSWLMSEVRTWWHLIAQNVKVSLTFEFYSFLLPTSYLFQPANVLQTNENYSN
jgi:hypothetical protein